MVAGSLVSNAVVQVGQFFPDFALHLVHVDQLDQPAYRTRFVIVLVDEKTPRPPEWRGDLAHLPDPGHTS